MAFKNEYVPPLEQESSEFFREAREILRTGYSEYNYWTVDRERDMVLLYVGGGHDVDSIDDEAWRFIDRKGIYHIYTTKLFESETSAEERAITRSFSYMVGGDGIVPDAETIACIKEAMQEWSRRFLFNLEHYKRCQLTLIDERTNGEI